MTEFGVECLRLKKGMQMAAALLESHRYAALLNATVEFDGLGGLALDPIRNTLHVSVTSIQGGMLDNVGARPGPADPGQHSPLRWPCRQPWPGTRPARRTPRRPSAQPLRCLHTPGLPLQPPAWEQGTRCRLRRHRQPPMSPHTLLPNPTQPNPTQPTLRAGVWDVTTGNDMRLSYNPCGCIYSLDLAAATFQATVLRATTCGSLDLSDPAQQACNAGSISNPSSLVYVQGSAAIGGDLLLIYEASERKDINMVRARTTAGPGQLPAAAAAGRPLG
jgi:hypothetical protein